MPGGDLDCAAHLSTLRQPRFRQLRQGGERLKSYRYDEEISQTNLANVIHQTVKSLWLAV